MAKEEIREGIKEAITFCPKEKNCPKGIGDTTDWRVCRDCMADNVMVYLHSQGVVIKGQSLGGSHPHLADYYTVESLIEVSNA